VNVADAYPRTPVKIEVQTFDNYEVPAGSRLVVETLSFYVNCPLAATIATGFLDSFTVNVPRYPFSLQLFSTDELKRFGVTQSVRIVLGPGDKLRGESTCGSVSANPSFSAMTAFGYLVSVNSPSLAP
jgi:hypothetical protein